MLPQRAWKPRVTFSLVRAAVQANSDSRVSLPALRLVVYWGRPRCPRGPLDLRGTPDLSTGGGQSCLDSPRTLRHRLPHRRGQGKVRLRKQGGATAFLKSFSLSPETYVIKGSTPNEYFQLCYNYLQETSR